MFDHDRLLAVFTFGGSGPALTAHGSLDLKQEIQIQAADEFFKRPTRRSWRIINFSFQLKYVLTAIVLII
jgi:hypothetical protein